MASDTFSGSNIGTIHFLAYPAHKKLYLAIFLSVRYSFFLTLNLTREVFDCL